MEFCFCFKGYPNRHLIHAQEHEFEKVGPGFEVKEDAGGGQEVSYRSTPETSDDESEDEYGGLKGLRA